MALRAEELRQDDLLLARYLRALGRHPDPDSDERTCPNCGERSRFQEDGSGGWSACSACGRLA